MKNYAVLEGMKRHQKTVLDDAFNKGYDQGYHDGKLDGEAENLEKLEKSLDAEKEAEYQRGYEQGRRSTITIKDFEEYYHKGLKHGQELRAKEAECAEACGMKRAWEAVRKIMYMSLFDLDELFPGWDVEHIIEKLSAKEVIEKVEAWEKQEQTKKNCKECEIYSKALRGKLTVKQIAENCDTCNNFSNVKPFEGCILKECHYEPKQEQTEQTCDTCEHGEAYKQGSDITTMDDECGGCCSWNSKWTPKEDTIGNSVKSIGFGDEVVDNLGHVMMVTYIAVESKCADVLMSDGTTDQMPLEILEKTGKHYDIQALLDAMKSEKTEEGGE